MQSRLVPCVASMFRIWPTSYSASGRRHSCELLARASQAIAREPTNGFLNGLHKDRKAGLGEPGGGFAHAETCNDLGQHHQ
jgi:hypothetical protein